MSSKYLQATGQSNHDCNDSDGIERPRGEHELYTDVSNRHTASRRDYLLRLKLLDDRAIHRQTCLNGSGKILIHANAAQVGR